MLSRRSTGAGSAGFIFIAPLSSCAPTEVTVVSSDAPEAQVLRPNPTSATNDATLVTDPGLSTHQANQAENFQDDDSGQEASDRPRRRRRRSRRGAGGEDSTPTVDGVESAAPTGENDARPLSSDVAGVATGGLGQDEASPSSA